MNARRVTVAVLVIAALAYLGYRVQRAGGLNELLDELRLMTGGPAATPTPGATGAPTASAPAASATPSTEAAAVLATMNTRRTDAGIAALAVNAVLQREAQQHADDMATRGYFSHDTPEGITFQQRMAASGYPSMTLAENIGLTSDGEATGVVAVWMNSSAHRTNLLDARFQAAGVGVARGRYQGQVAIYVVAVFGDTR
jgi:uncharacterized protein YkwD